MRPRAATIVWTTLPHAHGVFEEFTSPPIRPVRDAVTIWLRARTTFTHQKPFEVDFDDVDLRRIDTRAPAARP